MTRGRSRRPGDDDDAYEGRPLGVTLIVALGVLGILLTLVLVALTAGTGAGPAAFFLLLLSIPQAVVLVGLWSLASWAWAWGVFLYALAGLAALFGGNPGGALLNGLFTGYLIAIHPAFSE